MGIDVQLRSHIKDYVAPYAWIKEPASLANHVVIDDLLTRLYKDIGPYHNWNFTGRDLYSSFIRPVRKAFDQKGAIVYVAICDDSRNVPKEKAVEQSERSEASDVKPYDSTLQYKIIGDGLVTVSADGTESAAEMIDMRRLVRTRKLRRLYCDFVAQYAREFEFFGTGERYLIFDYDAVAGPCILPTPTPTSALVLPAHINQPHQLGEADVSVFYWCLQFHQYRKLVMTIDTDFIPILASYMQHTNEKREKYLLWRYDKDSLVDGVKMLADAQLKWGISLHSVTLLCILTGTDFYRKKSLTHGFGVKKLLEAFLETKDHWSEFGKDENSEVDDEECMKYFLWTLYNKRVKSPRGFFMIDMPPKRKAEGEVRAKRYFQWEPFLNALTPVCPKSYTPPTAGLIEAGITRIKWNQKYWVTFKNMGTTSYDDTQDETTATLVDDTESSSSSSVSVAVKPQAAKKAKVTSFASFLTDEQ